MMSEDNARLLDLVSQAPARRLGEAHRVIIEADAKMSKSSYGTHPDEGPYSPTWTDFGRAIANDEIAWWVREEVASLDVLKARASAAQHELQQLLEDARKLKNREYPAYHDLLDALDSYCSSHEGSIHIFCDFVEWLRSRNELAPVILFTYLVWGSSRRADRSTRVTAILTDAQLLQVCTEWVLGLRDGSTTTINRVLMEYQADLADSVDPEKYAGGLVVNYDRVRHLVSSAVLDRLVTYIALLRDSCRHIVEAADRLQKVDALLDDSNFWGTFVEATVKTKRTEEQWWELKESLAMWHTAPPAKSNKEADFCERVAAFANADGGVFVIGISNSVPRRAVGVPQMEDRIKHIHNVISTRIKIDQAAVKLRQVILHDENGFAKSCIVLAIARTPAVVDVKFDDGRRSYPVRVGPGLEWKDYDAVLRTKAQQKGYDWSFVDRLLPVVRET